MGFNHTFTYIKGDKQVEETRNLSASKAIRFKCLDCSGGNVAEVRGCGIPKCPLWPFRMGKSRPKDEKASARAKANFKKFGSGIDER